MSTSNFAFLVLPQKSLKSCSSQNSPISVYERALETELLFLFISLPFTVRHRCLPALRMDERLPARGRVQPRAEGKSPGQVEEGHRGVNVGPPTPLFPFSGLAPMATRPFFWASKSNRKNC